MEKESLGNGKADGKATQLGNIGKVGQDVDEGKGDGGDVPFRNRKKILIATWNADR
jgi:hypothetical protein